MIIQACGRTDPFRAPSVPNNTFNYSLWEGMISVTNSSCKIALHLLTGK